MQLELLTFRAVEPKDAKEYKAAVMESLPELQPYIETANFDAQRSVREHEYRIKHFRFGDEPSEEFVLMAGKLLVGYGWMAWRSGHNETELGLWVRTKFQGKGVGTFLLEKLAAEAKFTYRNQGVLLMNDAGNFAMSGLARKVGFQFLDTYPYFPERQETQRKIDEDILSGYYVRWVKYFENMKVNQPKVFRSQLDVLTKNQNQVA